MKQIILSLFLISFFFSCSDKDETTPEQDNGPVFVKEYENDYGVFKLSYDSQDRLSKVEHWITNGYTPTLFLSRVIEYQYTNDKLTGFTTRNGGAQTPLGDPILTTFVFNDKGHISQSVSEGKVAAVWKTDVEGRPTARLINNGPAPEWEYTADGNIKYKYQSISGVDWTQVSSGNITFNNESNPFYTNGTGMALYAAFGYVAGMAENLIAENLVTGILSETIFNNTGANPSSWKVSSTASITYTKDGTGLITNQKSNYKQEEWNNNVKKETTEESYSYKFTCFRK